MRLVAVILVLFSVACQQAAPSAALAGPPLVERTHATMGSELRLSAWTDDETGALAAFEEVFQEFDRLDRLMSVWKEGSDIVRLNAAAGTQPVRVSVETLMVLREARQISEWTGGKFEPPWRELHVVDGRC